MEVGISREWSTLFLFLRLHFHLSLFILKLEVFLNSLLSFDTNLGAELWHWVVTVGPFGDLQDVVKVLLDDVILVHQIDDLRYPIILFDH